MKSFIRIFLVLSLPFGCLRASVEDAFAAYEAKDYAAAARGFETAIAAGPASAGLYFDLAMALKKSDDPAGAAINLRRAIALDPRFTDARMALSEIERSKGIPLEQANWRSWLAEYAPLGVLLAAGFSLFWAGAFVLLAQAFRARASWPGSASGVLLAAAGAGLFVAAYYSDPRFAWRDMAVVVNGAGSKLSADPSERADAVARLPAATPLEAVRANGPWTYCRMADGRGGWVPTADLAMVIPTVKK